MDLDYAPLEVSEALKVPSNRPEVAYIYHVKSSTYNYGDTHLMKPARLGYTHDLLEAYGLLDKMKQIQIIPATKEEMKEAHTPEYIDFLTEACPSIKDDPRFQARISQHIGTSADELEDNPLFDGVYEFSALSAGGSLMGARELNKKESDIVINWAGGLHHAHKDRASGFCYVNDAVLAILDLLDGGHQRVLYIDIDVHHGDGVEAAFASTDRVMSFSIHAHKPGFFPESSGGIDYTGKGDGKNCAINIPLRDGINSHEYGHVFRAVLGKIIENFRPEAIVLQCGADSLAGDPVGQFNLHTEGHANCVLLVKSLGLPLLVLGGGGYAPINVARTWCFETGILIGQVLDNELPKSLKGRQLYKPSGYELTVPANIPSSIYPNKNDRKYLDGVIQTISERLRDRIHVPSVQSQPFDRRGMWDSSEGEEETEEDEDDVRRETNDHEPRARHRNQSQPEDDDDDNRLDQGNSTDDEEGSEYSSDNQKSDSEDDFDDPKSSNRRRSTRAKPNGGMGAGIPAAAPADAPRPDKRYAYAEQLRQLNAMGFREFDRNVDELRRSGGDVANALHWLLNQRRPVLRSSGPIIDDESEFEAEAEAEVEVEVEVEVVVEAGAGAGAEVEAEVKIEAEAAVESLEAEDEGEGNGEGEGEGEGEGKGDGKGEDEVQDGVGDGDEDVNKIEGSTV